MTGRKKGISPLIATVLLIAFTMTIAGLIMNFFTGFVNTQQASTTAKSTVTLNCAYAKLMANSGTATYNSTSTTLKVRLTNDDGNAQDAPLRNITFSLIMQDGSTNVYGAASGDSDGALDPGETDFFFNNSVTGGCNITSLYVSSSCSNAKDVVSSSGISFSGC